MSAEFVHSKCGKRTESVEIFAVSPQVRYVLDDEDGRYYETNVDESPESVMEEYICQECGQALSDEEVQRFQELIAHDNS